MSHSSLPNKSVRLLALCVSCVFCCCRLDTVYLPLYGASTYLPIGAAYGLSSNYNFEPGFGSGFDPIQTAVAKVDAEGSPYSELERDLIHAMATRSSAESKAAVDPAKLMFGELSVIGVCSGRASAGAAHLGSSSLYIVQLLILRGGNVPPGGKLKPTNNPAAQEYVEKHCSAKIYSRSNKLLHTTSRGAFMAEMALVRDVVPLS